MTQRDLADFGGGTPRGNSGQTTMDGPRVDTIGYMSMDEDAEPDNRWSCPWCCAPPRKFEQRYMDITGCGNCGAMIPIFKDGPVDWYEDGEKVCI